MAITIYADSNFGGGSQELQPGRYNINYPTVGDNTISSIKIPAGWEVTAYVGRDLSGESRVFSRSVATLDDFNDRISSIDVECLETELMVEFNVIFSP